MKYKNGNFYQKSKKAHVKLREAKASASTCYLYDVLCFDEHLYTGGKGGRNYFYRAMKDLAADSNLSEIQVKRLVAKLRALGLIETWLAPLIIKGKRTEFHVTHFRILD